MAGYADALGPEKFSGEHFKRWQVKATLCLKAMNVLWASNGKTEGEISDVDQKAFMDVNTISIGCIRSVLDNHLCDVYMHITNGKEIWDVVNSKFGTTVADSELYVMETFHDHTTVDNRYVVEQAHEI